MTALRSTVALSGSDTFTSLMPYAYKRDGSKPAVLSNVGQGGKSTQALDFASATGYPGKAANAAAQAGYPVVSLDGNTEWGNNTTISRMDRAKTYGQTATVGGKSGGVFVMGLSMGGLGALTWAHRNPSDCLGVLLFLSGFGLQWAYDNLDSGDRAEMDAAYTNHAGFTAALPTNDPEQYADEIASAGTPVLIAYSTDDLAGSEAQVLAMASALDAEVHSQTGGHSLVNLDTSVIKTFLDTNA